MQAKPRGQEARAVSWLKGVDGKWMGDGSLHWKSTIEKQRDTDQLYTVGTSMGQCRSVSCDKSAFQGKERQRQGNMLVSCSINGAWAQIYGEGEKRRETEIKKENGDRSRPIALTLYPLALALPGVLKLGKEQRTDVVNKILADVYVYICMYVHTYIHYTRILGQASQAQIQQEPAFQRGGSGGPAQPRPVPPPQPSVLPCPSCSSAPLAVFGINSMVVFGVSSFVTPLRPSKS